MERTCQNYIYLLFITLLIFTGCNDAVTDDTNSTVPDTNTTSLSNAPTANNFSVEINLNDGISSTNWKTDSNASDIDTDSVLTASIKTQGAKGTSSIENDNFIYTPTSIGTDTVVLTIKDNNDETIDININVNIILLDGLKILYATYDNNSTSTTHDDNLLLYFNKRYSPGSVYPIISENFDINGTMKIGSGSYVLKNFISFDIMEVSIRNYGTLSVEPDINTTISIKEDTVSDYAGNFPKEFTSIIVEKNNVFAHLITSSDICLNETNLSLRVNCNDINSTKNDSYYDINKPNRSFTTVGQIINDNDTNLIWQKEDDSNLRTFSEAYTYCEALNLENLTSWRLPMVNELVSITNKSEINTASYSEFTNTKNDVYFTNKINSENSNSVWAINFALANILTVEKNSMNLTRCVHD